MTIARAHVMNPALTRWYHCVTRCVRRAVLLGEGANDRKIWLDKRIEELLSALGRLHRPAIPERQGGALAECCRDRRATGHRGAYLASQAGGTS